MINFMSLVGFDTFRMYKHAVCFLTLIHIILSLIIRTFLVMIQYVIFYPPRLILFSHTKCTGLVHFPQRSFTKKVVHCRTKMTCVYTDVGTPKLCIYLVRPFGVLLYHSCALVMYRCIAHRR